MAPSHAPSSILVPSSMARSPVRSFLFPSSDARSPERSEPCCTKPCAKPCMLKITSEGSKGRRVQDGHYDRCFMEVVLRTTLNKSSPWNLEFFF